MCNDPQSKWARTPVLGKPKIKYPYRFMSSYVHGYIGSAADTNQKDISFMDTTVSSAFYYIIVPFARRTSSMSDNLNKFRTSELRRSCAKFCFYFGILHFRFSQ